MRKVAKGRISLWMVPTAKYSLKKTRNKSKAIIKAIIFLPITKLSQMTQAFITIG